MSGNLNWIFYYPYPDSPYDVLVQTANPYPGHIAHLWTLAKSERPILAEHIGRADCKFYIPPDLSFDPATTLFSRSRDWLLRHRDDGERAYSSQLVSRVFPHVPPSDRVHILVVTEELLEGLEDVGDLKAEALKKREKGIKSFQGSFVTPSYGVSSFQGLEKVIHGARNAFHAGRPDGNFGPPVSLFNHALGLFDYHLCHLDDESSTVVPPPSLIQLTHIFMVFSANNYSDESSRLIAIKGILNRIFVVPLNWQVSPNQFGIKPDAINLDGKPFLVVEVKNEAGLEGDSSLQAAISYAHIATSPVDKDSRVPSNYPAFSSNYPAVLFGIMGNLLEIGVATYTDGPYYNLVFSERLHLGFYAAKNLLRLARAFAATRRVIGDLMMFYDAPPNPDSDSIAHLFPSPLAVPTYTGLVPSLTFMRRLSRSGDFVVLAEDEITRQSGIYLATMARPPSADEDMVMSSSRDLLADTSEVIVKFTAQYHPEAHRILAAEGFAPELHACVPVCGGLFMVVMDLVYGTRACDLVHLNEAIPYDVYKDIHDAITLLHSNNLVFGDLRTPNMMVVPGTPGSDARCRGMLIDFDWVGSHGIARYPASLNDDLQDWVSGIQRYGIMDKAHDLELLNKFKDQCRLVELP